jgi:hypothetical protein
MRDGTMSIPVVRECPKCGWMYYQWVFVTESLTMDGSAFLSFISSVYRGIPDNPKFKEHDCRGIPDNPKFKEHDCRGEEK